MPEPANLEPPMGSGDVVPDLPYSPSIADSDPELIPDVSGAPADDAPINEYESTSKKPRDMDYDLKWIEQLQEPEADLQACFMECSDVMTIEFDLMFSSNRQIKNFISDPSAFMVKKMRDSEVVLSKLSKEHKELFARAKQKEVNSFVKAQAVRKALDEKELREAFGSNRIMRARWGSHMETHSSRGPAHSTSRSEIFTNNYNIHQRGRSQSQGENRPAWL